MKKNINFFSLIAAREGSKGLKNKNLIKINGKSIISLAAELSLKIKKIKHLIISSDSSKILNLVLSDKKIFKIKRRKNLALDKTPMLPVLRDALEQYEKKYKNKIDAIVILDPTSPLRKKKDILKAIDLFQKKKPDLLVSVHEAQHSPYFSMLEKNDSFYELCKDKNLNPGSRQDVQKVFEINTIVWIYSRNAILREKKRIPRRTIIFKTPYNRSIDIDTNDDITKINYYLNQI
jgi:CMP-N,N'-diacetyllegionaminic acid synthase